jgi:DNA-directed RNA polymerase specialized sigma24 family protein
MDLIHDVLLTLCEKEANPDNSFSFETVTRPYLRTRVHQVLCNIFTRGERISRSWELDPDKEGYEDEVRVDLEDNEQLTCLMKRINNLPDDNRTIMRMKALEYTYEEISDALRDKGVYLSPLAIRQRVFQIRRKLTDNTT